MEARVLFGLTRLEAVALDGTEVPLAKRRAVRRDPEGDVVYEQTDQGGLPLHRLQPARAPPADLLDTPWLRTASGPGARPRATCRSPSTRPPASPPWRPRSSATPPPSARPSIGSSAGWRRT
ncbi:MAG: hypothetical protein R3F43_22220 [bacterium]